MKGAQPSILLPLLAATLLSVGCRNWDVFSANYTPGAGGGGGGTQTSVGGGSGGGATGGGAAGGSTAGGAGGGSTAGGAGGGAGGGSALDGGTDDPLSCRGERASTCPAGALFCDGLNALLPGPWTEDELNGAVSSADTCTYRGARALRSALNGVAGGEQARAKVLELIAGATTPLYVRAYVRLPNVTAPSVRILEMRVADGGISEARLAVNGGQLSASASSGANPSSTASFAAGRWVCVEWRLVEGAPGTQTVWLDGTQVITGPFEVHNLARLGVGLHLTDHASATAAIEGFFDEVVVDDAPIGCAN